jgi:hypothetical protein
MINSPPSSPSGNLIPVLIGILVALAVAVILILLLIGRRPKPQRPSTVRYPIQRRPW